MALDIREFAETFFDPLLAAATDADDLQAMIRELGWQVEMNADQAVAMQTAMALPGHAATLAQALAALGAGPLDGAEVEALYEAVESILADLKALQSIDGGTLAQLPAPFSDRDELAAMAMALPEYLALSWLRDHAPAIYESLHFCGVIGETVIAPDLPKRMALNWAGLGELLANPGGAVAANYAWGGNFQHAAFLQNFARLMRAYGVAGDLGPVRPTLEDLLLGGDPPEDGVEYVLSAAQLRDRLPQPLAAELVLAPARQAGGAVDGVGICVVLGAAAGASADLGGGWRMELSGSGDGAGGAIVRSLGRGAARGPRLGDAGRGSPLAARRAGGSVR